MNLQDARGTIAVIVAFALPAILLGIGGAVETSRAVTFRQKLWSATELSCAQAAAYVNARKPLDAKTPLTELRYSSEVKDIADRNFAAKGLASPAVTWTATNLVDTLVKVDAAGSQPLVFSGLLSTQKLSFSASKTCAVMSTADANSAGPSAPELLFAESFERPSHNVAPSSWSVLGGKNNGETWNGWQTQAAGIEINGLRELAANAIRFGDFFAELDSDCNTAANSGNKTCQSNSTMSRLMNLTPGNYQVRYWYIARERDASIPGKVICGSKDSDVSYYTTNGQTNRIELYVEKSGNYNFAASSMVDVCVQADKWTERVIDFKVTTSSEYRISWRAAGKQDTFGGLIDYLRICRNACP